MYVRNRVLNAVVFFVMVFCGPGCLLPAYAYLNSDFAATPPFVSANVPPLVMLVMGRDEKLYHAAYNDLSDLKSGTRDDGSTDTHFNPYVLYYGYFDSNKCYQYTSSTFVPEGPATIATSTFPGPNNTSTTYTTEKCNAYVQSNSVNHGWSGNWLNYVTMSRMDVMRKVLYGGTRTTDSTSSTVLTGAYIPTDTHAWGKEYNITDGYAISDYTPFSTPTVGRHLFAVSSASEGATPRLRVLLNNVNRIWDWIDAEVVEGGDSSTPVNVVSSSAGAYNNNYPLNQYEFASQVQTFAPFSGQNYYTESPSQINASPPAAATNIHLHNYIDVFTGTLNVPTTNNYAFVCNGEDAVEVLIDGVVVAGWYGQHSKDTTTTLSTASQYAGTIYLTAGNHTLTFYHMQDNDSTSNYYLYWKNADITGSSYVIVPVYTSAMGGINGLLTHKFYYTNYPASTINDFYINVKACVPPTSGFPNSLENNCKAYSDGTTTTYKPTGLLQSYGESGHMLFGLMSGSYANNLQGGVLRKNIGPITNEINLTTGQFYTAPSGGGIIKTIDSFQIVKYNYNGQSSVYSDCKLGSQLQGSSVLLEETGPPQNGQCSMWGNPIGEMMYEALRYFNGASSATSSFTYSSGALDTQAPLSLPVPATWTDPYNNSTTGYPSCSKPFMLVLSDVDPSYDSNNFPSANSGIDSNFIGSGDPTLTDTIGAPSVATMDANGNITSVTGADPLNTKTLANTISTYEGISGSYYVGQIAGTSDSICSGKPIGTYGFGDIRGLCPAEPTMQGSYSAAAIAYYGRTHLIHYNTSGYGQNLMTYTVGMAPPLPNIMVSLGSNPNTNQPYTITMVPFGKAVGQYNIVRTYGNFQPTDAIVGYTIIDTLTPTHGTIRVSYADVEMGNDNDMDAVVIYEYQVLDENGAPTNIVSQGRTVRIITTCDYAAAGIDMHMGYTISGTTHDGPYLEVRQSSYSASDDQGLHYYADTPDGVWASSARTTPPSNNQYPLSSDGYYALPTQHSRTFNPQTSGVAPAQIPTNPLYYAAKYGGFQTNNPVTQYYKPVEGEWDSEGKKDSNGNSLPDTYFYVTNPLLLEQQLGNSFADILHRAASGTAASVISNSQSGAGAVYQSIFYPWNIDSAKNNVEWVGDVQALFVDNNGNLREDTPTGGSLVGDHQLEVVNQNTPVTFTSASALAGACGDLIVVFTSTTSGATVSKYADCTGTANLSTATLVASGQTMDSVHFLWRAGDWLNAGSTDPVTQRSTYSPASGSSDLNKRYIFTFIDNDSNNKQEMVQVNSSEQQAFSCPSLSSVTKAALTNKGSIYPYLNIFPPFESSVPSYVPSNTSTTNPSSAFLDFWNTQSCQVINYVRGKDYLVPTSSATYGYTIPAFRSRQFGYVLSNGDATIKTWRLGDIVNSTPTVVGRPGEGYNLLYQDTSYAYFLNQYLSRRNVVYVGANDGMLHAFNAGFYDTSNTRFTLQPWNNASSTYDTTKTPFVLGAELWAYVPFNLLPHLLWLTSPSYQHVYYVDHKPKIFDARIFPDDGVGGTHPYGWGTVMVVGMRFGGGTVCTNVDKTSNIETPSSNRGLSSSCVNSSDVPASSAYVVMDITNPEIPPKVLAELKFPGLGYTTCYPAVIPMANTKEGANNNDNTGDRWYLVFGSGPAEAGSDGSSGPETDGMAGTATQGSLGYAASAQSAKIFVVDLKHLAGTSPSVATLTGSSSAITSYPFSGYGSGTPAYYKALDANSFISDPIAVDYNLDYRADAVYFGTVSGTDKNSSGVVQIDSKGNLVYTWDGKLRRIYINNDTSVSDWVGDSVLMESTGLSQPITAAPTATLDAYGNSWVYFGTGRYFVSSDSSSQPQTYYGIKDPAFVLQSTTNCTSFQGDDCAINKTHLVDVSYATITTTTSSGAQTQTFTGVSVPTGVTIPAACQSTANSWGCWTSLMVEDSDPIKNITGTTGWMLNFGALGERNIGQAALLGATLTFTTYIPSTDICTFEGNSYLYGLYYLTGTPYFVPILGSTLVSNTNNSTTSIMTTFIPLGLGLSASPNIHVGSEQGSTVFVQTSTGAIRTINEANVAPTSSGRRGWRVIEQ